VKEVSHFLFPPQRGSEEGNNGKHKTVTEEIVLHDAARKRWLRFTRPHRVIEVSCIDNVIPSLKQIEARVNECGWHAAGFLSYESAAAFDPALTTRTPGDLPLLWFGLFPAPEEIALPSPDYRAYALGESLASAGEREYNRAIRRIKEYIHAGDTYQVNYTLRLETPFSGDPWQLFLAMVRAQSPGYAAWLDAGRYAVCSASPELFFHLNGHHLICKPMKGTVQRGRMQKEDALLSEWLQNSEKNRAENLMIVDMIRNDLGRVADTGSVHVPRLFEVERHPTLWQMTSTVAAQCSKSVTEILCALFPCASITGAPKVRTTEIIAKLEPTPRGLYTGCIGYLGPGRKAQFNVAIRTAVVDRRTSRVEYGSGGGIVWDSAPDDEYKEALLKARVLTEQRPEFSLLETMLWSSEDGYFLLRRHLDRLIDSANYFGYPVDCEEVKKLLREHANQFKLPQRVRLLVDAKGTARIEASELPLLPKLPVCLKLAHDPVNSADPFLYHKTTQRQVYDSAQRAFPDSEDVLLWNERGEITESCVANIVFELEGSLFTPPVDSGLLPGTFRADLIERGSVRERVLKVDDLQRCTKFYLINSVRKWREAVISTEESGPRGAVR
jgi:para-aminobenzoate synthetase/4-amino-4-deoxychorismate lyase